MVQLGLIVNPIAGIGGRVGLKGSDGATIQERALALGAVPRSQERAVEALQLLRPVEDLEIVTYPREMGGDAARACGFAPTAIGAIQAGRTTAEDTQRAAREMQRLNVALLLFAGGDGTARDVYTAVGTGLPTLGIPAGVKIHSAVYATNPRSAGALAALYLRGRVSRLREAEVMDIDEDAFRRGVVSARLYGYLKIPYRSSLVQGVKVASPPGEEAAMAAIAADVVEHMQEGCLYLIGPGTTTRAIAARLGVDKTLLGVDVVTVAKDTVVRGEVVATDANERQLLQLLQTREAKIVVTPIGGQGYILGRGNQQLSPQVIWAARADDREKLTVVSTRHKIDALGGRPLLVDTGDRALDRALSGYVRVITGYNEQVVYRVSGG